MSEPPPLPLPPFVLAQAAARLCPPRVTASGIPAPLPQDHHYEARDRESGEGEGTSTAQRRARVAARPGRLLDGWHLLMPQR